MGQRSDFTSLAAILNAFAQRRRWTQSALAERAGVKVPAVRRRLLELQSAGIPLDVEDDPPHKIWSVPEGWFPGAVLFDDAQSAELLRVLVQAPRSAARDRLIARVTNGLPRNEPVRSLARSVDVPTLDPGEERALSVLQGAVGVHVVRMHWYSENRGELEWREMSPQRIAVVPTPRAVGFCHRDRTLKWFKACNMVHVEHRAGAAFHAVEGPLVDNYIRETLHGYHGDSVEECVFRVRDAEWRWIRSQLRLSDPRIEEVGSGWRRVSVHTSGIVVLARCLLGLGDAVRAESPTLQARMRLLLQAAHEALNADPAVSR